MKIHSNTEARSEELEARSLDVSLPTSSFKLQTSPRSGIALIITLILLSVTLVMAVAFLALSRRERNAVATVTDTAMARLAADSALAAAQAQVVANIFTTNTAAYNFKLLVSTNYINGNGFDTTASAYANLNNVSYVYPNGNPVVGDDLIQNAANLLFLPRAPVFIPTNQPPYGYDFRYYLDLNRNGRYETNGVVTNIDNSFNGLGSTGFQVGDPEWIGVLERPDQPHGPNNHFIARYAFLAQPIGNGLDLNFIHNQVFDGRNQATGKPVVSPNINDAYFRNQGVGSWELNLAAFLADLNTNQWGKNMGTPVGDYWYQRIPGVNIGNAFYDACALLAYRYDNNYNSLAPVSQLVPFFGNAFRNDQIDGYGDGQLQTTVNTNADFFQDVPTLPWAGANNTNRFFSLLSDLADSAKSPGAPNIGFKGRLFNTGSSNATYDRYTFYRMLDQLGTDSSADGGKINLNYSNAVVQYDARGVMTSVAIIPGAETNMVPWAATNFFNVAADRMLRYYTGQWHDHNFGDFTNTFGTVTTNAFGVANIPVYVEGRFVYASSVNRLLQLAANLYDASLEATNLYPHVFRPFFLRVTTNGYDNIYITGFHEIGQLSSSGVAAIGIAPLDAPLDITAPGLVATGVAGPTTANANAYGIPWIIGAKKGLPNFNQFYMRNLVQVTRKLEVTRTEPSVPASMAGNVVTTNEMFVMSITNRIGFSFWNSYNAPYTNRSGLGVTVYFRDIVSMTLSNGANAWQSFYGNPNLVQFAFATNMTSWPGSSWNADPDRQKPEVQEADSLSFIHGYWDFNFLSQSWYKQSVPVFQLPTVGDKMEAFGYVPLLPEFQLMTTNHVQAIILDGNHVIDYVQLRGPNGARYLNGEINDTTPTGTGYWNTNFTGNTVYSGSGPNPATYGVVNQINTSRNPSAAPSTWGGAWKNPPNMPSTIKTPQAAAQYFDAFFTGDIANTNRSLQAPYTPTRSAWDLTLWRANDPLVHYLSSDLADYSSNTGLQHSDDLTQGEFPNSNPQLDSVVKRYQPWGRYAQMGAIPNVDTDGAYNLRLHDSLVWGSDYWNFPTNRLPNVGWIGRVHRGTPWQTIYLKQRNVLDEMTGNKPVGTNTWGYWTGDTQQSFFKGRYWDAANTAPIRDSDLFDLFTTRFNDNAAHGTLSVNQTHLAAWSAVLSGVVGLQNITEAPISSSTPVVTNTIISPAGVDAVNAVIGQIVNGQNGINATRSTFTNADGVVGEFEHAGDILRVPVLTELSPLIDRSDAVESGDRLKYDISDEVYEWLPQQIMGLLRVSTTPRYVVYCYGQALRPAAGSQVLTGNYFQMVTNYQVVAESAARAVIRVDQILVTNFSAVPPVVIKNYTTTVESYNPLPPD